MIKLIKDQRLGRFIQGDDGEDPGISTLDLVIRSIDEGHYREAKALVRYMVPEGEGLHDLFCDWIWDLLTKTAENNEDSTYQLCRTTQETWVLRRTWKILSKMSVEKRVYVNAEIMRYHRGETKQDHGIEVIEAEDRISIKMDPCGSGGRMR